MDAEIIDVPVPPILLYLFVCLFVFVWLHEILSIRLFELARNGEVDNLEFEQLDSLIYSSLEQTYRVTEADLCERHVVTSAA